MLCLAIYFSVSNRSFGKNYFSEWISSPYRLKFKHLLLLGLYQSHLSFPHLNSPSLPMVSRNYVGAISLWATGVYWQGWSIHLLVFKPRESYSGTQQHYIVELNLERRRFEHTSNWASQARAAGRSWESRLLFFWPRVSIYSKNDVPAYFQNRAEKSW